MRRWIKGLGIGLATGLLGVGFILTPLGADYEKRLGLTWLFKIRGAIDAPRDVVVVAIDARTGVSIDLSALPRDWPRSIHGRLVRNLKRLGASVIVFDMDFQRSRSAEEDAAFGDAIAEAGRVVLFERLDGKRLPLSVLTNGQGTNVDAKASGSVWIEQLIPPVPSLADAANALGPFPLPKLQEAVYQYWTFKSTTDDAATMPAAALQLHALDFYEPFTELLRDAGVPGLADLPRDGESLTTASSVRQIMQTLRRVFKQNQELLEQITEALDGTRENPFSVQQRQLIDALLNLYTGPDHRYLNFYGPPGTVTPIPYHEIIAADDPDAEGALDLNGKIAFVGFSDIYDPGQPDRFYTVFTDEHGVDLSGVEIAATALGNLLDNRELHPTDTLATMAVLFLFGGLIAAGVYLLPAIFSVPIALVLGVLYVMGAQHAFNTTDLWLPLTTPILLQLPLALFVGLMAQYLFGRRQERQLTEAIAYYLPENIVIDLTKGHVDPAHLNKTVHATCLATDMAGFSTIAETMSPDELATFMNDYFEALSEPLIEHNVDVTEFRADAIMCAWTADQPEQQIRRDAILAGLGAVDAINRFSDKAGRKQLSARIGLETGTVFVGHAGGGGHFVYSIVGDCANTASRIESLNKQLGTHLLATQPVVEGIDGLVLRSLGEFLLVGKKDAVSVVEVLALAAPASDDQRDLYQRFAQSLQAFRAGQWDQSVELFGSLLNDYPDDGPSRFYLDRCRRYLREPLQKNEMIIRMDTK